MKIRTSAAVGLLLSLALVAGVGQTQQESQYSRVAFIYNGLLKAGEFRDLPKDMREGYAIGLVNGLLVSPFLGANEQEVKLLNECMAGMSSLQISEIILKKVRNTPEKWHEPLNGVSFDAIVGACPALIRFVTK